MEKEYTLGAIKNDKDLRDVQLAQVQAPVALPSKYITDISWIPVFDQMQNGSCVGHAHAIVHIYNEFKENGIIRNLSPRYIYAMSKKMDGLPMQQGTQPRVAAAIEFNSGCATENTVPNQNSLEHNAYITLLDNPDIAKDARPFRIGGYAFVGNYGMPSKEQLKQAVYQNGVVPITISVGAFINPIPPGDFGLHRITVFGFEDLANGDTRFYYRNSWSRNWGNNGDGYFDYSSHAGKIYDCMAFPDLPNEILEDAKKKYKFFSMDEKTDATGKHTFSELTPEFRTLCDTMRGQCGFAWKILSGYRTQKENDALNDSVSDSAHVSRLAVDVLCTDSSKRDKIVTVAKANGIRRIGIGKNFVHLDIDSSKPQNVMWHYY